ncbi:WYL domain-containing protein [Achromobacter sp. Marseille-Q0513]|uniref:helix-turn-helix transcriptional regulator n=1 Tax=Achromobacter sp. Marseille-Q0513 TaxID=2829161 RepID=UPI001BA3340D|nr:WYL domain-containing protein [Achromobacter sp. Marseille-Q0513]MBR8655816.1 WYL domain-containing protein [Achromobacter sp. Marseille-Q0513]
MAVNAHDTLALRLAEILRLLHLGEPLDRHELAGRFGVSERTIYRDLNRLGDMVLPQADGRYRLAEAYRNRLSPGDLHAFAQISGIERMFPAGPDWSWLELLRSGKTGLLVRDSHVEADRPGSRDFRELKRAVENRRRCTVVYSGRRRLLEPYRLIHNKGIWYLAAVDDGRVKSFALSRMADLQVLDETFVPDADIHAQVEEDEDVWFGQSRLAVTVAVGRGGAYYFKRRHVLPHQELIEDRIDGSLLLRCRVNHPNQLLPILRYWIPHVRVVEPSWLQQQLRDELNQYLQSTLSE